MYSYQVANRIWEISLVVLAEKAHSIKQKTYLTIPKMTPGGHDPQIPVLQAAPHPMRSARSWCPSASFTFRLAMAQM